MRRSVFRIAVCPAAFLGNGACSRCALCRCVVCLLLTFIGVFLCGSLRAADSAGLPLHQQIDRMIDAGCQQRNVTPAGLASDAEFLRRVSLDLTGTIPSAVEASAFLGDASPDKRRKLIDRLLDSPQYARHMQRFFDVMLIERRVRLGRYTQGFPTHSEWRDYLRTSFLQNKPYDRLVWEILSASDEEIGSPLRHAAKFYYVRGINKDKLDTHLLTKDIGRLFLGIDLECARCHDHPSVDDYPQDRYYGLYAFLSRSFVFQDQRKKRAFLAEKGMGEVTYFSVFDPKKADHKAGLHLPGGSAMKEPKFDKGQEYLVKPAKDVRPVPRFSLRSQLADRLPGPRNKMFVRNIVNRLWAHMMDRGLVDPLDRHHRDNPPSHPELLVLLAERFEAMGFDIKAFWRELALSQTYQRASLLPVGTKDIPPESFAVALMKPLSAEEMGWSLMQATGRVDQVLQRLIRKLKTDDPKYYPILRTNAAWREQALHNSLSRYLGQFISTFGSPPGQPQREFQPTVSQALFLSNASMMYWGWLNPGGGNLMDRLMKQPDPRKTAKELYLSVFTRHPTPEEQALVAELLKEHSQDRESALKAMTWALLASAEFRVNH